MIEGVTSNLAAPLTLRQAAIGVASSVRHNEAGGSKGLFLVLLVATMWSGTLAFLFPYQATDDAAQYDRIAQNLVAGHGFSLSASAPFIPTMYREPVYPLFLSSVFLLAGHRYAAVQVAQVCLFVLTVLLVYFVARQAFDEQIGKISAFCVALAPPLANYPRYLLLETMFSCLLVALVWALLKTTSSRRLGWFLAAGFFWGATVLCKATAFLLLAPIMLAWLLLHRSTETRATRLACGYAVFLLSASALVTPWVMRNRKHFGADVFITMRGGRAIWERAQRLDYTATQMVQTVVFSLSERTGKSLFPNAVGRPRDFLLRESGLGNERVRTWQAAGLSEVDIDQRFMREGLARIREHPIVYLSQSGLEWLKMTAFSYLPILNEPYVQWQLERVPWAGLLLSLVKGLLRFLAFPILVFAGLGMYARKTQWRHWLFLALPIVVFNLAHGLLSGYGRYAVPLLPCYLIFASAGWFACSPALLRRIKRLQPLRAGAAILGLGSAP